MLSMHGLMKDGRHVKRLNKYFDSITDELIKGVYTKKNVFFLEK